MVPRAAGVLPVGRRGPEQLGQRLRRVRRGSRDARPLLLPRLPARAARPRLAQPRGARGDARRPALLVRARRRRLPDRRAAPADQGRPAARQPAQPGLARGRRPVRRADPGVHDRPARGAGRDPRDARRGRRRAAAAGRALPADRAARRLLRVRPRHAGELPPADARRGRRATIAELVERYEAALPDGAWPNWVLGNHDRPRLATRARPGQERAAAFLLLTLRGTPTLYYGDEIGMRDVDDRARPARRPVGVRQPRPGAHADAVGRRRLVHDRGEPWLPFAPDHARVNVAAQRDDPGSLLSLYRRLLALRRSEPDLRDRRLPDARAPTTASCASRAATRSRSTIDFELRRRIRSLGSAHGRRVALNKR